MFLLNRLPPLTLIAGPAVIIDQTQTLVVAPGSEARILSNHVVIEIKDALSARIIRDSTSVDSIQLSVFAHRFMSIAEQMGRALQKTAVSLNIKERLDFSCALFGPDGMFLHDEVQRMELTVRRWTGRERTSCSSASWLHELRSQVPARSSKGKTYTW